MPATAEKEDTNAVAFKNEGKGKPSWGYSVAASKAGGDLISRQLPKVERNIHVKAKVPLPPPPPPHSSVGKTSEVAPIRGVVSRKEGKEREASVGSKAVPTAAKGLFSAKVQTHTASSKKKAPAPVSVPAAEFAPPTPPAVSSPEQEFMPPKSDSRDIHQYSASELDSDYEEYEEYEHHEQYVKERVEFSPPPPPAPPKSPETHRYSADKAKTSRVVNLLSPPKAVKISGDTLNRGTGKPKK